MKRCFKCGQEKPLPQFYKHPQMGDGHLGKCITCTKKDVANREANLRANDPHWLAAERERCRKKQERARINGTASPIKPEYRTAWANKNGHKIRAEKQAHKAYKRGLLSKPNACESCGLITTKLEKHHPDYSRPLSVQWLCTGCHGKTRRLSLELVA